MAGAFPLWVIIIDYGLGVVMWTLIGRTAMNMFQPENSDFFFMKAFVRTYRPAYSALETHHPAIFAAAARAALCGVVFLSGAFLPHAVSAGLFGDGHVVFPAGRRGRRRPLCNL